MKQNKTLEEIKKEFHHKLLTAAMRGNWRYNIASVESFFDEAISQTKQELIEEIKEWSEYRRKNITGASVIESGKVLDKGSLFYDGYNQTIDELEEFLQKLSNK